MIRLQSLVAGIAVFLLSIPCSTLRAEEQAVQEIHHATRLGNPATRFAPTIFTVDDLRSRFSDPKLRPDFASVLRQWGWKGDVQDMFAAAATADVEEWKIAPGETMPFMSSREQGDAMCLRNVIWEGKEPISAYAFKFASKGRLYRCITPKPCSNFYVEDLGIEPIHQLALSCEAPPEQRIGRTADVCLILRNGGNCTESNLLLTLPVPGGVRVSTNTANGILTNGCVTWSVASLAASNTQEFCTTLSLRQVGLLSLTPAVSSSNAKSVQSSCSTQVTGIAAILLETADLQDPVEIGNTVTYVIKVTNQGNAAGTHVHMVCTLPDSEEFVSCKGITPASAQGRTVTMDVVDALLPKEIAEWHLVAKALKEDDARFNVTLSSDQFETPIRKEESTHLY